MFPRRAFASPANGILQGDTVEGNAPPDGNIVDGDAGVLAEQIFGPLGDRDILDHHVEDHAACCVCFVARQPLKPGFDVRRQYLQRLNVERFRDLFDFLHVHLHGQLLSTDFKTDFYGETASRNACLYYKCSARYSH